MRRRTLLKTRSLDSAGGDDTKDDPSGMRQARSPSKPVLVYKYLMNPPPQIRCIQLSKFRLYASAVIRAIQSSGSINHHPFSIASAAGLKKSICLLKDIEMKPSLLFVAIWFLLTNTNAEEFPTPLQAIHRPFRPRCESQGWCTKHRATTQC
jgi:hypothetical protein